MSLQATTKRHIIFTIWNHRESLCVAVKLLRVDPQHERLLGMEGDYPSAAAMPSALASSSENNRLSAISCVHQALTPIGASNSAYPDRQLKNAYKRISPLCDLSRQEPS